MGWGDNENSLKTTKHSSGEFESVDKLDSEGNVVLDEHDNPVKMRVEVLHDCGTFEITALPENVSNEEMSGYLETNYDTEMI
jgi:hypothetical protein